MKSPEKLIVIALGLTALAGCASVPRWQTVSTPIYTNSTQNYTVSLPSGWIKIAENNDSELLLSRNGVPLNLIAIYARDGANAFPTIKKQACLSPDELPSDLASGFIAESRALQKTAGQQLLKNEPAEIAGKQGFHISMQLLTQEGLNSGLEVYGLCASGKFYTLIYRAPEIYYFGQSLPVFNALVTSFKVTDSNP